METFSALLAICAGNSVPLHSTNGRHLPAVMVMQRDCHWGLKNGGNSQWSCRPIMQRGTRQSQSIFRLSTGTRHSLAHVLEYSLWFTVTSNHCPYASHRQATRSYPTRWRSKLGENGKRWISKFSLTNSTQILRYITADNIWNSYSLTYMRLLTKNLVTVFPLHLQPFADWRKIKFS